MLQIVVPFSARTHFLRVFNDVLQVFLMLLLGRRFIVDFIMGNLHNLEAFVPNSLHTFFLSLSKERTNLYTDHRSR